MIMVARLIGIYTPFICAIVAIIHGVLSLVNYDGILYYVFSEATGHSFLLITYIIATSKRMCKWYKITNYLLLSIHFVNLMYIFGFIDYYHIICTSLSLNILAFISFIIYRVTVGITKILC